MDEQLNNEQSAQPMAPEQPIEQNPVAQPQQTEQAQQPVAPPAQQPEKLSADKIQQKVPLLVKIIAWLMLLSGIGQLLFSFITIALNPIAGVPLFVIAVGLIVVSFGIRYLKPWALKTYMVIGGLTIISSAYNIVVAQKIDDKLVSAGSAIIAVLLILYFWRLSKGLPQKFV